MLSENTRIVRFLTFDRSINKSNKAAIKKGDTFIGADMDTSTQLHKNTSSSSVDNHEYFINSKKKQSSDSIAQSCTSYEKMSLFC